MGEVYRFELFGRDEGWDRNGSINENRVDYEWYCYYY